MLDPEFVGHDGCRVRFNVSMEVIVTDGFNGGRKSCEFSFVDLLILKFICCGLLLLQNLYVKMSLPLKWFASKDSLLVDKERDKRRLAWHSLVVDFLRLFNIGLNVGMR